MILEMEDQETDWFKISEFVWKYRSKKRSAPNPSQPQAVSRVDSLDSQAFMVNNQEPDKPATLPVSCLPLEVVMEAPKLTAGSDSDPWDYDSA